MKSSETSAKYSCPIKEQKLEIQDSAAAEDVDMAASTSSVVAGDRERGVLRLGFVGSRRRRRRRVCGRLLRVCAIVKGSREAVRREAWGVRRSRELYHGSGCMISTRRRDGVGGNCQA